MQCGRCQTEMEEGVCYLAQTGLGFLVAGLALPHLFFEPSGKRKETALSWHHPEPRALRCPKGYAE